MLSMKNQLIVISVYFASFSQADKKEWDVESEINAPSELSMHICHFGIQLAGSVSELKK